MSKKSRKRNKRLLMMAALAGGAALMGRNKRIRATDSPGNAKAAAIQAMTSDAAYSPPVKKAPIRKDVPDVAVDKKVIIGSGDVPIGRMRGAGTDEQAIANQKIRAAYAQKGRGINPFEQTAAAGAAYVPRIPRVHKRGINYRMKAGGSVTGIAKRGFGRALKKK